MLEEHHFNMKKIKIKKKIYKIPENWSDITFNQFRLLDANGTFIDELPENEKVEALIKILTDIPDEIILNLSEEQKSKILTNISQAVSQKIDIVKNPFFFLNGKYYHFEHNIQKILIGQYVDYNMITKGVKNPLDVSHKVASILIKEIKPKSIWKLWYKKFRKQALTKKDFIIGNYDSDTLDSLSELLYEKLPIQYIITANKLFEELNLKLKTIYERLFQDDSLPDETDKIIKTRPNTSRLEAYNTKWGFYILIRDLANKDLTRFDDITNLNIWMVFNELSFQIETQDINKEIKNP